ncbi:FAD-dependent oxidoreductase [Microbacterium paludicola]|uniref:FAD-dependent oxidoreductase n=1 Tax=Microbacterium paludicola TaxID=300019 RepID=A0A4Y9FSP3_9MICO|nr:FAD/NAD(P)-binding oxidoreductase [Microbacterium paludicola]MBF0817279.1 NAD(P)/FAD-dependent oxidoreductase [Microbacterium paludicola]TFU31986.1 FAD-dependent oxidoreductase [Microbacterium paludicola]
MTHAVLVVGGGPAGLAAAAAALDAGASVTLLDSGRDVGGQYWRHLPTERSGEHESLLHHGWERFAALRADVTARATVLLEGQVWSIQPDRDAPGGLAVDIATGPADGIDGEPHRFRPDAIVLATGAHDRTLPFPGWELPGVFTGGAAQALAKSERIRIGEHVVVAGAGPFLLPVAASVAETGARVAGVFEANRIPALTRGWLPRPWELVGAAGKGRELAGYVGAFARHRIPYRLGAAVVAAHGEEHVESVTITDVAADWSPIAGSERTIAADAVCVTHGFTPRIELAIAAGCAIDRGFVTVDDRQRTSVRGVYAAGEITGIGGVDKALAEGTIAGHAAAGWPPDAPRSLRAALRRRATAAGFAKRLEAAHGIRSGWHSWLRDDTLVCRCEEVSYGAVRRTAAATSAEGLRSLKLATRAGLGACQGRMCGRSLEELAARLSPSGALRDAGHGPGRGASTDRRPIVTPQRLGDLARLASPPPPSDGLPRTTTN